jgi:DNA polymerase (family X)
MTKNNAGGASTRLADPQIPIHLRAVDDQSTVPIQNRPRQPRQAYVRRLCEKCRLNERMSSIRILKSAEVDILADGSLDYPDELLRELDYTVCSIHSRFAIGKAEQTERIMRAMDNRYFTILGHATGRLLLKRPGCEIDIERVIDHARKRGCFFEINSSPDRLDLSADNARLARDGGV